jgi:hypothetical protein
MQTILKKEKDAYKTIQTGGGGCQFETGSLLIDDEQPAKTP